MKILILILKTETLYVDLSPQVLRKELIANYDYYNDENCPCENTLRRILNDLGYKLRRVKKLL